VEPAWDRIEHEHLAERVYDAIRDRILRRAIPCDEQIQIAEIATELGVSRTPVVDAVKRLASEGLVEIRARRGSFVRSLSEDDIREIFELRVALETFAARSAIGSGKTTDLAEQMHHWLQVMEAEMQGGGFGDYLRFTVADQAFHAALINAQNNARASAIYDNLNVHMHVARSHLFQGLEPPARVHADHQKILKAIRGRNSAAADKAITDHLRSIESKMIENVRLSGGAI